MLKKNALPRVELALMRESFLKCLVDYVAYPNEECDLSKEEAIYLCVDSGAGLETFMLLLSQKTWRDSVHNGTHLILARLWTVYCQLLTLLFLYTHYFTNTLQLQNFHPYDTFDSDYFAISTHKSNSENDKLIQAGVVPWLTVEKLSIIAWKVFAPSLAENIPMKYSPDSE